MENHGASMMRWRRLIVTWAAGTMAAGLCVFSIDAAATRAYAVVDARILAGPGDDYPVVGQVNRGAAVDLNRCLPDFSWCNVSSGPHRGWVYGEQVTAAYRDNVNALTDASYREVAEGSRETPDTPCVTSASDTAFYVDTLPQD
jgi:uncharacterized protein YraI